MLAYIRRVNRNTTIKVKLLAALVFFLVIVLTALNLYSVRRNEAMIRQKEMETYRFIVNTVRSAMRQKFQEADTAVHTIARNPEIQRLFAERQRDQLLALLAPVYEALKPSVSQFHFHLPDSTSFLRVHFPQEYGDSLQAYRLTVNECNATHSVVSGLEEGIAGFGFRVVAPMTYQGRHTGSVEYGMDFGREFLAQLKQNLEGDYFLYRIVNGVVDLHVGTRDTDVCFIQSPQIETILADQPVLKISNDQRIGYILVPFRTFRGEVQGFIKIVLDRRELADQMLALKRAALILEGGGILGMTAVFFLLISTFLRPVSQIVEQTRRISAEISRGNFMFRGNVEETSVDFQDIIAQINQIIQALRESESQKQAILDAFPGMIAYIDPQFTVLWANRTMLDLHPDLIGLRCSEAMKDCHHDFCAECLIENAMQSGDVRKNVCQYFDLFGRQEITHWENIAVPIESADHHVRGCIKISWDITEQKRLEHVIRDLNHTLEERVQQEIEKRKEQEQLMYQQSKLAALGELAAGIAHEINQPLNTMAFAMDNVFSKFRKRTISEEYLERKIALLSEEVQRIRVIIDHVRTFSREQHSEELQAAFDVNTGVEKALSLVQAQYHNHRILLETDLAPNLTPVLGNLYQFEQVVLNFLSNAKDALEEKRDLLGPFEMRISLRTSEDEDAVYLEVEDNGIGIEASRQSQIFDPFYTTKGPDKGTGLGLSISYGLIKTMSGSLDVESRPDHGTRMRVVFPKPMTATAQPLAAINATVEQPETSNL